MIRSYFLEIVNGTMAVGGLLLLTVIGKYLLDEKSTLRGRAVARAIGCFILGDTIIRFWLWIWRNRLNNGYDVEFFENVPVVLIGYIIAIIGVFCMLRVFSFYRFKPWV